MEVQAPVNNLAIYSNPLLMGLQERDFDHVRHREGLLCITDCIASFRQCGKKEARIYYLRAKPRDVVITKLQFPRHDGKLGRAVDCCSFQHLLVILSRLPGDLAQQLRNEQADLAARACVGDEQLEQAMPIRREQLSEEMRHEVLPPPAKKRRLELEEKKEQMLEEIELAKVYQEHAKVVFETALFPIDLYKQALLQREADVNDRDNAFITDEVKNCALHALRTTQQGSMSSLLLRQPKVELPLTNVMLAIAPHPKPQGDQLTSLLLKAGKFAAERYRTNNSRSPHKVTRFVAGANRDVNVYYEEDRSLLEQACRDALNTCSSPRLVTIDKMFPPLN